MKTPFYILTLGLIQGALSGLVARNACNADNCARAVTGTRPGKLPVVSVRQSDCSSFMLITVTPPASTTHVTKTTTITTTLPVLAKRHPPAQGPVTVSPSVVPTYASACSGAARYSSACSCWGITQATTTVPTPITTVTVYTTVTAAVCPPGDTKCGANCYNLQTSNGNCGSCGHTCSPGTTCQSGSCAPIAGTCSNPTVCTGNDACGAPGNSNCYCHPDSNGIGYCHPAAECDFPTCDTNADCAHGAVCVENCCGKVCRDVLPVCDNASVKVRRRLMMGKRGSGKGWTEPGSP